MAGDFSDDEWDISDDQLEALEHNAILSTQQQASADSRRNGSVNPTAASKNLNQPSTERLDVSSDLRRIAAANGSRQSLQQPVSAEDSFDNPAVDEDGIPDVVVEQPQIYVSHTRIDEATEKEQWRVNRFAQRHGPQPQYRPPAKSIPHQAYQQYQQTHNVIQSAKYEQQQPPKHPDMQQDVQPSGHTPESEALRSMLEELRKEKDLLTKSLNDTTTQLYTARGEISVIRSKTINDTKAAERQMSILKKQMQEEATKHHAAIQSKEAVYSELKTNTDFLKHELDEQTRKLQTLRRQAKERPLQDRPNDVNLSPKKGLTNVLRDGFDDDSGIMQMSPSRSPARPRSSKPNTPTKKRKQPTTNDVDVPSLVLRLNGDQTMANPDKTTPKERTEPKIERDHKSEQHLQFVQNVLAFRPGQQSIIEALVEFAFPSDASRPLSSILLTETSKLRGDRLPGDLLGLFIAWLDQCHKEDYYKPLALILTTISHILDIEPTIVDVKVIETVVLPLQTLTAINPRTRWTLTTNKAAVWDDEHPKPKYQPLVDTSACLDLLCIVASLAIDEPELNQLFWSFMQTEPVLLCLYPRQRLPVVTLMLELLTTSIRPTTFGIICDNPEFQARTETYIIDKISFLLWDPPEPVVKTHHDKLSAHSKSSRRYPRSKVELEPVFPPPTRLEICHLRLTALSVLIKFILTSLPHPHEAYIEAHHGTNFILNHPNAIARLVRLLYDETFSLYANHPTTRSLHTQLVARTIALLRHVLLSPQATAPDSPFNLTKALSGTLGGANKFRVVMTRIALRDEVLEAEDISDETVELAKQILREYVTPDEAEQLSEAFGHVNIRDDDEDVYIDEDAEAEVIADVAG